MTFFSKKHVFCPVVVTWTQIRELNLLREVVSRETWKTLYFFGIRVAMWRVEGSE